jgi:hypothetical protein
MKAMENGLILSDGEYYDFRLSPALSGAMDLSNMQIMSSKVSLHIAGQLLLQHYFI